MSGRNEKLQDAIGLVSDEFVEEAHGADAHDAPAVKPAAKRTSLRTRALALAACVAVVAGVGVFAMVGLQGNIGQAPENAEVESVAAEVYSEGLPAAGREATGDYAVESLKAMSDESAISAAGEAAAADVAAVSPGEGASLAAGSIAVGAGDIPDEVEVEAGLLTAAEWNDNRNWPFFTNLVNAGTIRFPSFGIDPRHRVRVSVSDESGDAVRGERVALRDEGGAVLWQATSGKDGTAYLFYRDGETPALVTAASGGEQPLSVRGAGQQGPQVSIPVDDVALTVPKPAGATGSPEREQVMFIVDTTGSMSDEIAYLQADFASIAADAGGEGVSYSANFYRDNGENEAYATKCNPFTDDVATVQRQLNDEYADGGGDEPEAVADILKETITDNTAWRDDAAKIAFLVFDAPPHEGTDAVLDAAVRSAAERGIRVVPVVASNASRDTELFGRALAICTDASYVFLTDDSGIGEAHLEPIVGDYTVEPLHDVIVRLIREAR